MAIVATFADGTIPCVNCSDAGTHAYAHIERFCNPRRAIRNSASSA
jgi:hypothetical protein